MKKDSKWILTFQDMDDYDCEFDIIYLFDDKAEAEKEAADATIRKKRNIQLFHGMKHKISPNTIAEAEGRNIGARFRLKEISYDNNQEFQRNRRIAKTNKEFREYERLRRKFEK